MNKNIKVVLTMSIVFLMVGCSGPVYKTRWVAATGSTVDASLQVDKCKLEASSRKSQWIAANPIPKPCAFTSMGSPCYAATIKSQRMNREAKDIYDTAFRVCAREQGLTTKKVCVKRCN